MKIKKSYSGGMKFIDKSRGQPIVVSKQIAKKIRGGNRKNKKT